MCLSSSTEGRAGRSICGWNATNWWHWVGRHVALVYLGTIASLLSESRCILVAISRGRSARKLIVTKE
jgi:hypothetical protein